MSDWQDHAVQAGWISREAAERLAEQVRDLKAALENMTEDRDLILAAKMRAESRPTYGDGYQEGFADAMNDVAGT